MTSLGHPTKKPEAISASQTLEQIYQRVRQHTLELIAPLSPEDMVVQSMPDASPAKWHLAHTTWFFETFLLTPHVADYPVFHPDYGFLFNSYYEALGPRQPRAARGLLTRPPMSDVLAYRQHVDHHMQGLLQGDLTSDQMESVRLGLAHEEQHQELLLMDILHLFSQSPIKPAYGPPSETIKLVEPAGFHLRPGGLVEIGHDGDGFAFDNEGPRHKVWLQPFEINDKLVTNGDWLTFMRDGGYTRAELWLSDGWTTVQTQQWNAPLYWQAEGNDWQVMTLAGLQPVDPDASVSNISFYEADAYARWAGGRLPTEAEWEAAARDGVLKQVNDSVWQWTASAYLPYPGFKPALSAVGEYNGKFMSGQMVLRGGSSLTPKDHARLTYRNFFKPEQRWMQSGLRLARDLGDNHAALPSQNAEFAADVVAGLSARHKSLSPKYFYDALGSELFEAICQTPEYYPTRTEMALLTSIAADLTSDIPEDAVLVEFGSGASDKTRLLLDAAPQITAYVPVDISEDALRQATLRLKRDYQHLDVFPVAGDFTAGVTLPHALSGRPLIGFFPGSTIGNFTPDQARSLLKVMHATLGKGARLIIGADMIKDEATLVAAYDDAGGVTARFNKNLLTRINRELSGNFDLNTFEHLAVWNKTLARMEMHLVSRCDQIVHAAHHTFAFKAGERLHTENSHKFTLESFRALAASAGLKVERDWVSPAPQFAVFQLIT
ncbi:MAG: ergothioneine biosynthesis protein EgtB [Asticcacaulis sp.]